MAGRGEWKSLFTINSTCVGWIDQCVNNINHGISPFFWSVNYLPANPDFSEWIHSQNLPNRLYKQVSAYGSYANFSLQLFAIDLCVVTADPSHTVLYMLSDWMKEKAEQVNNEEQIMPCPVWIFGWIIFFLRFVKLLGSRSWPFSRIHSECVNNKYDPGNKREPSSLLYFF